MGKRAETRDDNRNHPTHDTSHGQRSIDRAQGGNQEELHNTTRTTGQPQAESGGESDPNVQVSLQVSVSGGR